MPSAKFSSPVGDAWQEENLLYKHVTRRLPGNSSRMRPGFWVHNHPELSGTSGPFPTQMQAAKYIADKTDTTISDLRKTRCVVSSGTPPASRSLHSEFVGVHWDSRANAWRAEAGDSEKGTRQRSPPCRGKGGEKRAAEIYAEWQDDDGNAKRAKKIHTNTSDMQERMTIMSHIYNITRRRHEGPGDYEAAVEHARGAPKKVFDKCAEIEVASVCGKYGPWKDSLIRSYNASATKFADDLEVSESAPLFRECCRQALQRCDGVDFSTWRDNCGRNVAFHSDFIQFNLRLKIIRTAQPGDRGAMDFGAQESKYVFVTKPRQKKESMEVIKKFICLCRKWRKTIGDPKNTATWWTATYQSLLLDSVSSGVPALQYNEKLGKKEHGWATLIVLEGEIGLLGAIKPLKAL